MSVSRKIVIIGSSRFPIAEPFAGGLEAHVWQLARSLSQRGHDVTLFAAPGSDPRVARRELGVRRVRLSEPGRRDIARTPEISLDEHHAYLSVMLELADPETTRFDIVHNHSLHYLPVAMARSLPMPMLTTLHTPPIAWLESAVQSDPVQDSSLVAVSEFTAAQWRNDETAVGVVPNGVDLDLWLAGPGGDGLIWFGRVDARSRGVALSWVGVPPASPGLDPAGRTSRRHPAQCRHLPSSMGTWPMQGWLAGFAALDMVEFRGDVGWVRTDPAPSSDRHRSGVG
jgi:glycosyltransferase involved in cell wall biosynthesis